MAEMKNTATEIISAMKEANNKEPTGYDTTAEVVRIEDNTAWCHIPGGVDETPVSLTIGAEVGDTVQVRVSGGNAWITGNLTDPPTSDKTATEALKMASSAQKTVERGLMSDTLYYLASDQDSGITVDTEGWTEEPQEITEEIPYLWIYHLYTYADGSTEKTTPVIVGVYGQQGEQGPQGEEGPQGDEGDPGVSVTSVTPRYYLSTSSSSVTGGSWSDSLPSYVSGRYYWTRDKITYSNGTTGYSTATYSPGLTQSVQLSYDTAQHFWTQTTGTTAVPTGAYVTEATESSYKSSPNGGATLIRSDKVDIRVGSATYSRFDGNGTHIYDGNGTAASNVLAEFTGSGATIGKSTEAQVNIDYHSMSMADKDDNKLFEVMDLRGTNGTFQYTDTFTGNGTTKSFYLTYTATNTSYTVTTSPSAGTPTKYTNRIYFSTAPAADTTITVTYYSASTLARSLAFGLGITTQPLMAAFGSYNEGKTGNILEVGAGSSSSSRKNVFEVKKSGRAYIDAHDAEIGAYRECYELLQLTANSTSWQTPPEYLDDYVSTRIKLTAGTWVISAQMEIQQGTTPAGRRALRIYRTASTVTDSSSENYGTGGYDKSAVNQTPTAGADATKLQTTAILNIEDNKEVTITVQVWSNATASQIAMGYLTAAHIA